MADFVDRCAAMATDPYLSTTQAMDWLGVLALAAHQRENDAP